MPSTPEEEKQPQPAAENHPEPAETMAVPSSASGTSQKTKRRSSKRDEMIGTTLGKYQIVGVLGRGGMGVVYQAYDSLIDRQVAIKMLPRDQAENDDAWRRLLLEAQAAGRLNHQNTVGVYDAGMEGDVYYVVLELVTGGSVSKKLSKGPYSWKEATRIIAEACQGVAAAHAAGMTHRDIKPANLIFADDGTVKVADFGLASAPGLVGASLSNVGDILGTPHYMSPEQCESQPVDERTDIYSLGATYYSLLTAEMPYESRATMQVMYAHVHSDPPDPWKIDPEIPAACKSIIEKAMAKSPSNRYATVEEMLRDLHNVLAGTDTVTTNAGETRILADSPANKPKHESARIEPRTRAWEKRGIGNEVPELVISQAKVTEAQEEDTLCGQMRRVIHDSGRQLAEIAEDVGIVPQHLAEFLEGTRTLRSDVLERILQAMSAKVVISPRRRS